MGDRICQRDLENHGSLQRYSLRSGLLACAIRPWQIHREDVFRIVGRSYREVDSFQGMSGEDLFPTISFGIGTDMDMVTTRTGVWYRPTAITHVRFQDLELEWEVGREVRRLGEGGFPRVHPSAAALAVSAADDDYRFI